jgi:hypothetical protein
MQLIYGTHWLLQQLVAPADLTSGAVVGSGDSLNCTQTGVGCDDSRDPGIWLVACLGMLSKIVLQAGPVCPAAVPETVSDDCLALAAAAACGDVLWLWPVLPLQLADNQGDRDILVRRCISGACQVRRIA